jgi:hypothetical protein
MADDHHGRPQIELKIENSCPDTREEFIYTIIFCFFPQSGLHSLPQIFLKYIGMELTGSMWDINSEKNYFMFCIIFPLRTFPLIPYNTK